MLGSFCLLVLSACARELPRYAAGPDALATGFYEDIDTPRLALLEYRLGRYFAQRDRPYEVVCASQERPSVASGITERLPLEPEKELALLKRFPGLSPLTRCKTRGNDIIAADTGVPAAIFDVNDFTCETPDECLGWGGYFANGQHGWSYYRMRFRDGAWRIRREELDIVVT